MKSLDSRGKSRFGPWGSHADKGSRSVKSAERTLALFELFSLRQQPLTIGEIAEALNIPQPSASMLVHNVVRLGYLEQDRETRTYIPTVRIMLLGSWIHRRFARDLEFERQLDDLVRLVGETVTLTIRNGIYAQYVSAQLPDDPGRMEVQSGMLRPITCTAAGRVLLSLSSDAEIASVVRRCNAEVEDARLRVQPGEFQAIIDDVRRTGFAETSGSMTAGYGVIATQIRAPVGKMPMAIGVAMAVERIDAKRDLVRAALDQFRSRFRPMPQDEDES